MFITVEAMVFIWISSVFSLVIWGKLDKKKTCLLRHHSCEFPHGMMINGSSLLPPIIIIYIIIKNKRDISSPVIIMISTKSRPSHITLTATHHVTLQRTEIIISLMQLADGLFVADNMTSDFTESMYLILAGLTWVMIHNSKEQTSWVSRLSIFITSVFCAPSFVQPPSLLLLLLWRRV